MITQASGQGSPGTSPPGVRLWGACLISRISVNSRIESLDDF